MTDLRIAAQQALEAMNYSGMDVGKFNRINAACAALRDALAQPEQGPVAWQWLDTGHFRKKLPVDAEPGAWNPLYTHLLRRTGLPHCERSCEEKAFQIEIRRLKAEKAELLEALRNIVNLWDHHASAHGDGIIYPLHRAARESIAKVEGTNA